MQTIKKTSENVDNLLNKGIKTEGEIIDDYLYVDKNKDRLKAEFVAAMKESGLFSDKELENAYPLVAQCAEDGEIRTGLTPGDIGKLIGSSRNCVQNWCRSGKVESYFSIDGYCRIIPINEVIRLVREKR